MTTATQDDVAHDLLDRLHPPCELPESHQCGRPDKPCQHPAQWIVRYTCHCPNPGALVICDPHRKHMHRQRGAQICTRCHHQPRVTSTERIG